MSELSASPVTISRTPELSHTDTHRPDSPTSTPTTAGSGLAEQGVVAEDLANDALAPPRRWRVVFIADPVLEEDPSGMTAGYTPGPDRPSWWTTITVDQEEYELLKSACPHAIFLSNHVENVGSQSFSVEASEWVRAHRLLYIRC